MKTKLIGEYILILDYVNKESTVRCRRNDTDLLYCDYLLEENTTETEINVAVCMGAPGFGVLRIQENEN